MKPKPTIKPDLIGRTPGESVPVFVRQGIGYDIGAILPIPVKRQRLALVSDKTVSRLHGSRVLRGLTARGWKVDTYELPDGERLKTARVVAQLHEQWLENGYDRATPVIAVGGGTVGDGVGFAAATYMRGLPLWHVPTTLVGQVDSSVGGKVGINHVRGKNLIGSFYQPSGVLIDPAFLKTLPSREIRSGLAEVIKYGIISDKRLFRDCENRVSDWISAHKQIDTSTLKACVAIKLRVVRSDEHDTGIRHILNLGHTLGHAFEAWGKFKIFKHGEAVALGMVAASFIAAKRRMLPQPAFDRIVSLCRRIAPSKRTVRFDPESVIPYLATDKKRVSGHNTWVLPVEIGRVTIVRDVADKDIRAAIGFAREWAGA